MTGGGMVGRFRTTTYREFKDLVMLFVERLTLLPGDMQ
jgi:hypothetical protein